VHPGAGLNAHLGVMMSWHEDFRLWVDASPNGDASATIRLAGELDITSTKAARRAVAELAPATPRIVVDLSRITFCDVAGLRILLALQQQAKDAGTDLILYYLHRSVRRIAELAGMRPPVPPGGTDGFAPPPAPSRAVVAACEQAVGQALEAAGADTGDVQLPDSATGALRIAAHHGFGRRFLDFFEAVHDDDSACGAALAAGRAVWVPEVATSPIFAATPALEAMLEAGSQAVASVPVRAGNGSVIAMLSVHCYQPTTWSPPRRRQLAAVATATGQLLSRT
jgi:anti-anti-sigma factor